MNPMFVLMAFLCTAMCHFRLLFHTCVPPKNKLKGKKDIYFKLLRRTRKLSPLTSFLTSEFLNGPWDILSEQDPSLYRSYFCSGQEVWQHLSPDTSGSLSDSGPGILPSLLVSSLNWGKLRSFSVPQFPHL